MDVKIAARETRQLAIGMVDTNSRDKSGFIHTRYLLDEIIKGRVTGEKAHRWLAWAQCSVYQNNVNTTLGNFKDINKRA